MQIENPDYQWEVLFNNSKPKKDISNWKPIFGPKVIDRNSDNTAEKVRFNILLDNPRVKLYLVGDFNNWGNDSNLEDFLLGSDDFSIIHYIETDKIKHKDKYKFMMINLKGEKRYLQDPAGVYFDHEGNSIFWDYEDPSSYKQKYDFIDNFSRSIKILQTDLPGLITHFANKQGVCGKDITKDNYYDFISDSGVIDHIKELGYNTIQFLPFAQSIDGDNWKFRYLVPYQYAIQKNWGNPDQFARMIDKFHEKGIAVIGDFVLGHLPDRDYRIFGQDCEDAGIHLWKDRNDKSLYFKDHTPWGTRRINFDNYYVRKFFISSVTHFMKYYKIDGFRIDNVDGIIRFGDNGDGDERPNGRKFLRELNQEIYDYNPKAMINYEAHFYWGDNAKMLVAPMNSDKRALGATAYNSSRITYYFHTKYMFKSAEEITVWKFRDINEEKEWGKSNSTVADFHNHDAAAGLMEMRCTGSYAFDALTVNDNSGGFHAMGKIKVMEAIISFCTEGRTLDLAQTFLLQKGTFEHDSSIHWFLTFNDMNRYMTNFKSSINKIMDRKPFWPLYNRNRKFLNVDDQNKVLVVEKSSDNEKFVVLINTSGWTFHNYKVGVTDKSNYKLELNSDEGHYNGTNLTECPRDLENKPSSNFELLDREFEIPKVGPYTVLVFKKND